MMVTVTVPAATAVGNYAVTLQGTTGPSPTPLNASYTLTVALNPDFVLTGPPTFRTVNAGSTTANGSVETTATDGFNSPVSLTCSLLTTNGSCSVTPSPVTSFPIFVGVVVNAIGLVAGSEQFTVTGTSASRTHTVVVPFNVADYQLSGPASITLPPNGQGIAYLTITPSAFYNGTVNISCTTGSLGGQCPVTPNSTPVTAGTNVSVTSTINVPSNALPGVYAINVTSEDISAAPIHNLSIPLTVSQDYTVGNFSPTTQTISAGQSATYNLSVLPVGAGYSNSVTLSCAVTPLFAGACTFAPNPTGPLSNSTSAAVVMTVTTQTTNSPLHPPEAKSHPWYYAVWLIFPGIVAWGAGRGRRHGAAMSFAFALCLLFCLLSCGGGSNGSSGNGSPGGGVQGGTLPGTYTINVVGSPASLSQPKGSSVTLIVQ